MAFIMSTSRPDVPEKVYWKIDPTSAKGQFGKRGAYFVPANARLNSQRDSNLQIGYGFILFDLYNFVGSAQSIFPLWDMDPTFNTSLIIFLPS